MKRVWAGLCRWVSRESSHDDQKISVFAIQVFVCAFVGFTHLALAIFFLFTDFAMLLPVSLGCLLLGLCSVYFAGKGNTLVAGLLLSVSAVCYSFLLLLWFGNEGVCLLHLSVVLVMQVILRYAGVGVRTWTGIAVWVAAIAAILFAQTLKPMFTLSASQMLVFRLLNLQIGFFGIVAELFIGNIVRDNVARHKDQQIEEYMEDVTRDPLTGLYNRRYAYVFLNKTLAEDPQARLCVATLDFDDFKEINDRYGHAAGDVVLKKIADVCLSSLRRTDVVIRWGGDEFMIFLKDVGVEQAFSVLDQLRARIAETSCDIGDMMVHVTVTIGVIPMNWEDIERSMQESDDKLYYGKQFKNRVIR